MPLLTSVATNWIHWNIWPHQTHRYIRWRTFNVNSKHNIDVVTKKVQGTVCNTTTTTYIKSSIWWILLSRTSISLPLALWFTSIRSSPIYFIVNGSHINTHLLNIPKWNLSHSNKLNSIVKLDNIFILLYSLLMFSLNGCIETVQHIYNFIIYLRLISLWLYLNRYSIVDCWVSLKYSINQIQQCIRRQKGRRKSKLTRIR